MMIIPTTLIACGIALLYQQQLVYLNSLRTSFEKLSSTNHHISSNDIINNYSHDNKNDFQLRLHAILALESIDQDAMNRKNDASNGLLSNPLLLCKDQCVDTNQKMISDMLITKKKLSTSSSRLRDDEHWISVSITNSQKQGIYQKDVKWTQQSAYFVPMSFGNFIRAKSSIDGSNVNDHDQPYDNIIYVHNAKHDDINDVGISDVVVHIATIDNTAEESNRSIINDNHVVVDNHDSIRSIAELELSPIDDTQVNEMIASDNESFFEENSSTIMHSTTGYEEGIDVEQPNGQRLERVPLGLISVSANNDVELLFANHDSIIEESATLLDMHDRDAFSLAEESDNDIIPSDLSVSSDLEASRIVDEAIVVNVTTMIFPVKDKVSNLSHDAPSNDASDSDEFEEFYEESDIAENNVNSNQHDEPAAGDNAGNNDNDDGDHDDDTDKIILEVASRNVPDFARIESKDAAPQPDTSVSWLFFIAGAIFALLLRWAFVKSQDLTTRFEDWRIDTIETTAVNMLTAGKTIEAAHYLEASLDEIIRIRGREHTDFAAMKHLLAKAQLILGWNEYAEQLLLDILRIYTPFGEDSTSARVLEDLAKAQEGLHKLAESHMNLTRALSIYEREEKAASNQINEPEEYSQQLIQRAKEIASYLSCENDIASPSSSVSGSPNPAGSKSPHEIVAIRLELLADQATLQKPIDHSISEELEEVAKLCADIDSILSTPDATLIPNDENGEDYAAEVDTSLNSQLICTTGDEISIEVPLETVNSDLFVSTPLPKPIQSLMSTGKKGFGISFGSPRSLYGRRPITPYSAHRIAGSTLSLPRFPMNGEQSEAFDHSQHFINSAAYVEESPDTVAVFCSPDELGYGIGVEAMDGVNEVVSVLNLQD